MGFVSREQIQTARVADLYDYLLQKHPDAVKRENNWLRLKSNTSLCMKKGCGGYKDYATLETGNSIDFLVNHMNYSFKEAVISLSNQISASGRSGPEKRRIVFPLQAENDTAIRKYLAGRGVPGFLVTRLEAAGLLYQDLNRNAVFCSSNRDFYEIRGTWPGKPFHQNGKKEPGCFWAYVPGDVPEKAYICESAIDAVSLYLLHMRDGMSVDNNTAYCGIAGVANQQAIEKIKQWCTTAIIAVDNDAAGEQCRIRNADIPAVVPRLKDWNEDLTHTHSMCKSCV